MSDQAESARTRSPTRLLYITARKTRPPTISRRIAKPNIISPPAFVLGTRATYHTVPGHATPGECGFPSAACFPGPGNGVESAGLTHAGSETTEGAGSPLRADPADAG